MRRSKENLLSVGVVGAGLVSDLHLDFLRNQKNTEIAGIADTDTSRAQAKAELYGTEAFGSLEDLLRATQPQVIHLLTPPSSHAQLCVLALQSGAHVYIEKPLAVSETDALTIERAGHEANREVCVGHCMIYDPLMRRARSLMRNGEIGYPLEVSVSYCFDPDRLADLGASHWYHRLPGGHLEDLAAHPASLLLDVIGDVKSHYASPLGPVNGIEGILVLVRGSRASGTLTVTLGTRPEDVTMEIRGTKALIRIDFSNMVLTVDRERGLPKKLARGVKNLEMAVQLTAQTVGSTFQFLAGRLDTTKGIHTLVDEFHRRLRAGEDSPIKVSEGTAVVRLLRDIWPESANGARHL